MGRGSARLCSRRQWSREGISRYLLCEPLWLKTKKSLTTEGTEGHRGKPAQLFKSERCSISEGLLEDWGAQLRRRRADPTNISLGMWLESEFHPPNGRYRLMPPRLRLRAGRGRLPQCRQPSSANRARLHGSAL